MVPKKKFTFYNSFPYQPDSLLSLTHVAKGGNPNATLRSEFVKIVVFDPMELRRDNATTDNATSAISGLNRKEFPLNLIIICVERF